MEAVLDRLQATLDQLVEAGPTATGDAASVIRLHAQLARLEAATTEAVAHFDANHRWSSAGARSAATWLAAHCRVRCARREGGSASVAR